VQSDVYDNLVLAGEKLTRRIRLSRDDIAAFAHLSGDTNPLHVDAQVAQRARFGEIIASGQHTVALLMGLLASHFSRVQGGTARQMIVLNTNFAFKRPVFADQEIGLQWIVSGVEWSARMKGMLAHLDGAAAVALALPSVVARATILLTVAQT
jgi:acyl dehydratase